MVILVVSERQWTVGGVWWDGAARDQVPQGMVANNPNPPHMDTAFFQKELGGWDRLRVYQKRLVHEGLGAGWLELP